MASMEIERSLCHCSTFSKFTELGWGLDQAVQVFLNGLFFTMPVHNYL
ncbi:hypothetical protein C7477_12834 [Phyllobacterium leguminum]|uniref:Uncharacterized protein n=1 Tax=Phyllobacterium leguminum TaxID=314237 RepID=A0A318SY63_9HYPH|nr:hypothetical protein C7477_12834 [Phyllobacterium leguminum]